MGGRRSLRLLGEFLQVFDGVGWHLGISVLTCGLCRKYTEWVKENEPDVLTYCTMTRPKAPNEVMLFERYKNPKALGAHGSTKQFKAML